MDYLKQYRSFINSHQLSDGVRMTAGILLPALILGYCNLLAAGITVSVGALGVSITDIPGPIIHRKNGLLACTVIVFITSLITGFALQISWLFIIVLPILCFFFSMIGVYGARASSIGVAALLVMILQTRVHYAPAQVIYNSLYILAGGTWYLLLSLALYSIRPYKLVQQALGEYIMAAADYLKIKASFYNKAPDYDKNYQRLLSAQLSMQETQKLVAELIFKTRSIVKESTNTGRIIMMIFMDVNDLFERAMTSHQDYEKLHEYFDETGILEEYGQLIYSLTIELDDIGIALKSGNASGYDKNIDSRLEKERSHLEQLRVTVMSSKNVEGFISLRHILDSIDDIAARIRTLHQYTTFDKKIKGKKQQAPDADEFVSRTDLDPGLLTDNFSFRSNIFRHSIRITLAALFAYCIGLSFPQGHSYWILLTVIVILKPGYSLTKQRNIQRLSGTLLGAAGGTLLLYLIKDKTTTLVVLGICMIGAYTFLRKQYLTSVILMTIYLLLMFHLIEPNDFKTIFNERIIDTILGSFIAFLFSYILSPIWEKETLNSYMTSILKDNIDYYRQIATVFTGAPADKVTSTVKRKNSWVSLANLSDAFNRMLAEPKSKQQDMQNLHQFVVANHMLASHIATLSYYTDNLEPQFILQDYEPLINNSILNLENSLRSIENVEEAAIPAHHEHEGTNLLENKINTLMITRQKEVTEGRLETGTKKFLSTFKSIADQFYFIYKVSVDLQKITPRIRKIT